LTLLILTYLLLIVYVVTWKSFRLQDFCRGPTANPLFGLSLMFASNHLALKTLFLLSLFYFISSSNFKCLNRSICPHTHTHTPFLFLSSQSYTIHFRHGKLLKDWLFDAQLRITHSIEDNYQSNCFKRMLLHQPSFNWRGNCKKREISSSMWPWLKVGLIASTSMKFETCFIYLSCSESVHIK